MIVDPGVTGEVPETLLELFSRYNQDLWPAHVVAYLLAIPLVWALAEPAASLRSPLRSRLPALVMGILLTWLGVAFQALYATDVSRPLGIAYAALFIVGGLATIAAGVRGHLLVDTSPPPFSRLVGLTAVGYAVLVYPVLGHAFGHGWPESPLFGMAPCPTVIALFGVLVLSHPRARHLWVLPIAWTLLATLPAVERGVWEDVGMVVFGALALVATRLESRTRPRSGTGSTGSPPSLRADRRGRSVPTAPPGSRGSPGP
jgi:hypothetical protein